jgi:hypothetical protein
MLSDKRTTIFIREKPIVSSERILRKEYDRHVSVEKKTISGRDSQKAWREDKLIGGKPSDVK